MKKKTKQYKKIGRKHWDNINYTKARQKVQENRQKRDTVGPSKDKIIVDVAIRIWQEIRNRQRYTEAFFRMTTQGRQ